MSGTQIELVSRLPRTHGDRIISFAVCIEPLQLKVQLFWNHWLRCERRGPVHRSPPNIKLEKAKLKWHGMRHVIGWETDIKTMLACTIYIKRTFSLAHTQSTYYSRAEHNFLRLLQRRAFLYGSNVLRKCLSCRSTSAWHLSLSFGIQQKGHRRAER